MVLWTLFVISMTLIKIVFSNMPEKDFEIDDFPLSKSLGFSIRQGYGKTLDDADGGQEYKMLYNEMLKDSQIGIHRVQGLDVTRRSGRADRRRGIRNLSPVAAQQARSQALRREKLNSQSLRSNLEHSQYPIYTKL